MRDDGELWLRAVLRHPSLLIRQLWCQQESSFTHGGSHKVALSSQSVLSAAAIRAAAPAEVIEAVIAAETQHQHQWWKES